MIRLKPDRTRKNLKNKKDSNIKNLILSTDINTELLSKETNNKEQIENNNNIVEKIYPYNIISTELNIIEIDDIPDEYIDFNNYKSLLVRSPDKIIQSIGIISGGSISIRKDLCTIECSSGIGYIKILDDNNVITNTFVIPETNNILLEKNHMNYIFIDYNNNNPYVSNTTNFSNINFSSQFIIGICIIDYYKQNIFIKHL